MSRACDFCEEDEIPPEQYPDHLREDCPVVGNDPQSTLDEHDQAHEEDRKVVADD